MNMNQLISLLQKIPQGLCEFDITLINVNYLHKSIDVSVSCERGKEYLIVDGNTEEVDGGVRTKGIPAAVYSKCSSDDVGWTQKDSSSSSSRKREDKYIRETRKAIRRRYPKAGSDPISSISLNNSDSR